MKIRQGFVSNSSSSSFMLSKSGLSKHQIDSMRDHINSFKKYAKDHNIEKDEYDMYGDFGCVEPHDSWEVCEKQNVIFFSTIIDNFDLLEYAEVLEIPNDNIEYFDFYFYDNDVEKIYQKWLISQRSNKLKRIVK